MVHTCVAVFCTSSNSPSKLASNKSASGSKLTRRANFVLPCSLNEDLARFTKFDDSGSGAGRSSSLAAFALIALSISSMVVVVVTVSDVLAVSAVECCAAIVAGSAFSGAFSVSGNRNDGGISMRLETN